MKWKTKARLQNAISLLPDKASYAMYYALQRTFGGLRNINPVQRLEAGVEICDFSLKYGPGVRGKTVLELGTGRTVNLPLALWLCGAELIYSIDLNPYLKKELVEKSLEYITHHQEIIKGIFKENLVKERWHTLMAFCNSREVFELDAFLSLLNLKYIAPGDATKLPLDDGVIDLYISYTTLEHIPEDILVSILSEARRVLDSRGLEVHKVDFSDHFSHDDKSITSINFLKYDSEKWKKLAGNRYMYMNRLRVGEIERLFRDSGVEVVAKTYDMDEFVLDRLEELRDSLSEPFRSMSDQALTVRSAWILARKRGELVERTAVM